MTYNTWSESCLLVAHSFARAELFDKPTSAAHWAELASELRCFSGDDYRASKSRHRKESILVCGLSRGVILCERFEHHLQLLKVLAFSRGFLFQARRKGLLAERTRQLGEVAGERGILRQGAGR
jgi:hypothetical protein